MYSSFEDQTADVDKVDLMVVSLDLNRGTFHDNQVTIIR